MKTVKLEKVYRIGHHVYPKGFVLKEKDASNFENWDLITAEDPFNPHLTIYLRRGEFSYVEEDLSLLYNHAVILGYKGTLEPFVVGRNYIHEKKYKRVVEFDPLYTMDDLLAMYVDYSDKAAQGDKSHEIAADICYRRYVFLEGLKELVAEYNTIYAAE